MDLGVALGPSLRAKGQSAVPLGQFCAVTSWAKAFCLFTPQRNQDSAGACSDFLHLGRVILLTPRKEKLCYFLKTECPGQGCVSDKRCAPPFLLAAGVRCDPLGRVWSPGGGGAGAENSPVLQVTAQNHTEVLRATAGVFLLCVASGSRRALFSVLWGLVQPLPPGAQVPEEVGLGGRSGASTLGAVQAGAGGGKKAQELVRNFLSVDVRV